MMEKISFMSELFKAQTEARSKTDRKGFLIGEEISSWLLVFWHLKIYLYRIIRFLHRGPQLFLMQCLIQKSKVYVR